MRLTTRYSLLAFNLNALLDQGVSMPIDEVRELIDDGSLLDRLEKRFGGEPHYFDISLLDADEERRAVLRVFSALADNVDEKRKFGLTRNGLALLLAYCIEVMQSPDAYADYDHAGE
jgi:hypothetical protein